MVVQTTVYRERLMGLAAAGGPIYVHFLRTSMAIDARAKYYLSGVMANVRTGNLRSSQAPPIVTTTGESIVGIVQNLAKYAFYVHEGTKPHEITATRARFLRFDPGNVISAAGSGGGQEATGSFVFRKTVQHPGTEPRPFLKRAMEDIILGRGL